MVPSYGSRSTVLPQTGYKLGSWTLTAGTAEDINVNGLSFNMTFGGSGGTAFAITDMADMYATYQIGSGAVVTTSVTPSPSNPNSVSVSFTLPKGQTATINLFSSLKVGPGTGRTVQADLTVSGTGAQSGAAASIASNVVGPIITVANASLTITRDASTPVSTLLVGGNTVKTVSYKIESINDAHTISQMVFSLAGTNGTSAMQTVYLKDGSTILASAPASGTVTFNLSTPLTIPANSTKVVDIEVALGPIGYGAGATGADVKAELTSVLARPQSTGTAATKPVTRQAGNSMYAYKAIPTITLGTLPSSNLQPGTNTISRFTVASTGGTIEWNKIIFNVSKSDADGDTVLGAISNVQLWNGSTQVLGTAVVAADLGLNGTQTGTITFYPTNAEQVSGSKTYDLRVNVAGTVATGDSITVSIPNTSTTFIASNKAFASRTVGAATAYYSDVATVGTVSVGDVRITAVGTYVAGTVVADGDTDINTVLTPGISGTASFIWSDMSAQSHSIATEDWTTDFLVKNLPTNTQALQR